MYFTYETYTDNWNKIADIFSKDAILKGSFDKFAVSTKGKRGTTTVDSEFLKEIEQWREMLAKIIALRNRTLSTQEINFAVQRTIDRILFLRMCEDRAIEEYGQLLKISKQVSVSKLLCELTPHLLDIQYLKDLLSEDNELLKRCGVSRCLCGSPECSSSAKHTFGMPKCNFFKLLSSA